MITALRVVPSRTSRSFRPKETAMVVVVAPFESLCPNGEPRSNPAMLCSLYNYRCNLISSDTSGKRWEHWPKNKYIWSDTMQMAGPEAAAHCYLRLGGEWIHASETVSQRWSWHIFFTDILLSKSAFETKENLAILWYFWVTMSLAEPCVWNISRNDRQNSAVKASTGPF